MAEAQQSEPTGPREQSTAALVRQLADQVTTLVRDEAELARQELGRKGRQAGAGAGALGAGAVLAWYGGGGLVAAAILAIAQVLRPWLAALIVGAALVVLAGAAALTGRGQIRRVTPPVPQRVMGSVRADVDAVRQGMHRR